MADCDRAFGAPYPPPDAPFMQDKLDYLQANHQNLFADSH
jgi:hypothetical protein